jgi:hypothetical protein
MRTVNINVIAAPKAYKDFKVWHSKRCGTLDNLTADERWVQMGNKLPVKHDNKRIKKSVE